MSNIINVTDSVTYFFLLVMLYFIYGYIWIIKCFSFLIIFNQEGCDIMNNKARAYLYKIILLLIIIIFKLLFD